MTSDAQQLVSVFEERAENLSKDELENWTKLTPTEDQVLRKLKGPGAKLLSGPRGSGKSTLLKLAYFGLVGDSDSLPIYVNYSRALALEPLFYSRANAVELFRQWVIAKVLVGLEEAVKLKSSVPTPVQQQMFDQSKDLVRQLELGTAPESLVFQMSPSELLSHLESWSSQWGFSRVVLLLDDAAHAFSFRQQREFFEVFRELRSRRVSPKAAIYPGITSFSPNFHVGHEAELLEAWLRPDTDAFLSSMRDMAVRRIPADLLAKLGSNRDEHLDVLALASFGLPRGFLNMVSWVLDEVSQTSTSSSVRKSVLEAIDIHADSVRAVFNNVADKLPRFTNFVNVGISLERAALKALREFNSNKSLHSKATTIALGSPISNELDRVLKLLEYSGIVRRLASLSKGEKGAYDRYVFHYAFLISSTALALGRSYPLAAVSEALRKPSAHALVKTKAVTLLGADFQKRCTLSLPPCPKCNAARISEDQRFCMTCGAELANASIYLELLNAPVERLPLPAGKISAIKRFTKVKTVQDILTDDELTLRQPGSYIGPVWARRIHTVAEEYVSV